MVGQIEMGNSKCKCRRPRVVLLYIQPCKNNKLCGRLPQYAAALCKLTFDLQNGVRVTWATSVPILVFIGLSVLDLGPMYATDIRQTRIIA